MANVLGIDVREVQQGWMTPFANSFPRRRPDAQREESLYETAVDDNQVDPADLLAETDMREHLAEAIRRLPEREQLVLSLYYFDELNFKEVGKVLNISESRACQLHARALINLKAIIHNDE
jgi:RNA polymerase sigma factor for flagellar operon FliA